MTVEVDSGLSTSHVAEASSITHNGASPLSRLSGASGGCGGAGGSFLRRFTLAHDVTHDGTMAPGNLAKELASGLSFRFERRRPASFARYCCTRDRILGILRSVRSRVQGDE